MIKGNLCLQNLLFSPKFITSKITYLEPFALVKIYCITRIYNVLQTSLVNSIGLFLIVLFSDFKIKKKKILYNLIISTKPALYAHKYIILKDGNFSGLDSDSRDQNSIRPILRISKPIFLAPVYLQVRVWVTRRIFYEPMDRPKSKGLGQWVELFE